MITTSRNLFEGTMVTQKLHLFDMYFSYNDIVELEAFFLVLRNVDFQALFALVAFLDIRIKHPELLHFVLKQPKN